MKLTKSELREMIKEELLNEFSSTKTSFSAFDVVTGTYSFIDIAEDTADEDYREIEYDKKTINNLIKLLKSAVGGSYKYTGENLDFKGNNRHITIEAMQNLSKLKNITVKYVVYYDYDKE